ncbi:hypothetical protein HY498_05695 [Candidatus Woesearchaeota archaeon]|nr:hypothetical protein [Candidatus Woesearchaeota archaeon]
MVICPVMTVNKKLFFILVLMTLLTTIISCKERIVYYICPNGDQVTNSSLCFTNNDEQEKSVIIGEPSNYYLFNGTDNLVTNTFHLKEGLTQFRFLYLGDNDFFVDIKNVDTGISSNILSELGRYDGKRILTIKEGNYLLIIKAGVRKSGDPAPWLVSIRQ